MFERSYSIPTLFETRAAIGTAETPAEPIIDTLKKEGYKVTIFDPHVKKFSHELHSFNKVMESPYLILLTDHAKIIDLLENRDLSDKVIFDTRNALKTIKCKKKIVLGNRLKL